jgi:hypothetical protein
MARNHRSATKPWPLNAWTREDARAAILGAIRKRLARGGTWPPNHWTPAQAREMGSRGGLKGEHPNRLANLKLGPAAAVAARAEYMRLKRAREKASE